MARQVDRKPGKGGLSHIDARGRARMVDVGEKPITERVATAAATIRMNPATLRLIRSGKVAKGEVLAVARIAGILAAKRTAEIVPLCHPLPIEVCGIDFTPRAGGRLDIEATVKVSGKTGVSSVHAKVHADAARTRRRSGRAGVAEVEGVRAMAGAGPQPSTTWSVSPVAVAAAGLGSFLASPSVTTSSFGRRSSLPRLLTTRRRREKLTK